MIAGDNLFDFALADFVELLAPRRASASAPRRVRLRRPRARHALRRRRARRGRPRRRVRGEAVGAAQHARRDGDLPLPPRPAAARRAVPRRGQPARPAGAPGRLALPAASRSTATASTGAWFDIGNPDQLLEADNRWRARAGLPEREAYTTLAEPRSTDLGGRCAGWARQGRSASGLRPRIGCAPGAAERPVTTRPSAHARRPGASRALPITRPVDPGWWPAPPGPSADAGADPAQTRAPAPPACRRVLLDAPAAPLPCCAPPGRRALRGCCDRPAADRRRRSARAAARPSRGRSHGAASAPAAGSRSPPRGPPSPTTAPSGPLVSAWKERGLRGIASLAAEVVDEAVRAARRRDLITFVPPDGDRSLRRGHHPPQRLAGSSAAAGSFPSRRSSGGRARSGRNAGFARDERRRNVRGAFRAAARPAAASCSSTTSTRPASTVVGRRLGAAGGRRGLGRGRDFRARRSVS